MYIIMFSNADNDNSKTIEDIVDCHTSTVIGKTGNILEPAKSTIAKAIKQGHKIIIEPYSGQQ